MTRLPHAMRRFRADVRGLALIEFALTAPILLTLGLAGAEVTHMAIAVLRVHQISTAISDNVARVRDSIDEADVNEALLSSRFIGDGIDFNRFGRIVVSSVEPNGLSGGSAGQYIRWQRCAGALNVTASRPQYGVEGKGEKDNSLTAMGSGSRTIAAGSGSALIFVEVTYQYQPLVSARFFGTPVLRSESVFNVRERNSQVLGNAGGTTPSSCTKYAA